MFVGMQVKVFVAEWGPASEMPPRALSCAAASILLACACSAASCPAGASAIPRAGGSAAARPIAPRGAICARGATLRLRGGEDAADEYKTVYDRIDGVMQATLGRSVWGLLKALIGWHDKPKRSPSQELQELQEEMGARKLRGNLIDRKFLYFLSKGVVYTLNPLTHVSRFLAGTEKSVRSGVLFVNAERASMSVADLRAKLAAPKSKGGMGLANARISEVFYRAALEYTKEDMEAPVKELAFADEDDAELEEFKKKALENAAKKGGGGASEKKLHSAATKKWTGASGNVVKRLQKELIGIQSTGRSCSSTTSPAIQLSRSRRQAFARAHTRTSYAPVSPRLSSLPQLASWRSVFGQPGSQTRRGFLELRARDTLLPHVLKKQSLC